MQWDRSKNLGFSSAPAEKLYLPVDASKDAPVVSEALEGKNILFTAVRELVALHRKSSALLADASFEILHGEDDSFPLVYTRKGTDENLLVALNPTAGEVCCTVPEGKYSPVWSFHEASIANRQVILPPVSAMIAVQKTP